MEENVETVATKHTGVTTIILQNNSDDSHTVSTASPLKEIPNVKVFGVQTNATKNDSPIDGTPSSIRSSGPKVCYRTEYRSLDGTTFYNRNGTEGDGTKEPSTVHEGPVFDVVDVNYTLETKDTKKSEQAPTKPGKTAPTEATPYVRWRGQQYVRIYSRAIVNALQSVVNYYPYGPIVGHPINIYEPYAILVHHWELLEKFRDNFHPDKTGTPHTDCKVADTYEHLGYLLDFMERNLRDKVNREYQRWKEPIPKVSYEMLWLLLTPGIDVYNDEDENGVHEPWVVSKVSFGPSGILNKAWDQYEISLWNLVGDEDSIQPCEKEFTIPRFHGEKPIRDLIIFPCNYLENHEQRKQKMIERGKSFFKLRQNRCMYYDGEGDAFPRVPYKGYVMVDPVQEQEDLDFRPLRQNGPDAEDLAELVDQKPSELPLCDCSHCSTIESERTKPAKFDGYKKIEMKKTTELTEHQYFICARSTWAFVLGIRDWRKLFVDNFTEPKWDLGLIDSLVLKHPYKNMLQNLSRLFINQQKSATTAEEKDEQRKKDKQHATTPWTADYIENKGKGLVFLLHGKPGVGKTYTAECIAHLVQRPLLSVTCADIGVEPSEIEEKLRRWFKIARRWDAIMLLDEADIYMEFRQTHDLTRNNLVASFLRAIEYYDGVLFLTTNRIGTFDETFLSRVTAIYYSDFDDDDRKRIWENYFEKLEQERADEIHVPRSTKEYAVDSTDVRELKWNGREIRNAFQIAVNLAQAEGIKDKNGSIVVKPKHIEVTVELSRDFKKYMVSIHGKTPSELASIGKLRRDDYNAPRETGIQQPV